MRASFALYNTPAEVDALVAAVRDSQRLLRGGLSPMQMEQLYQEIILDHYRTPHHFGLRDPFDAEVHHVNPTCGDEVTLRVHLVPSRRCRRRPRIRRGRGHLVRGAGLLDLPGVDLGAHRPGHRPAADEVLATLDEFTAMVTSRGTIDGDEDVLGDGIAFAGVSKYPARVKCALLGWMAFKDAAAQSRRQRRRRHAGDA